jgi:hypothetical protein
MWPSSPSSQRRSGPVWSRMPSALRSSASRDRIGRPGTASPITTSASDPPISFRRCHLVVTSARTALGFLAAEDLLEIGLRKRAGLSLPRKSDPWKSIAVLEHSVARLPLCLFLYAVLDIYQDRASRKEKGSVCL